MPPIIVLVRPQLGENIGAAARAIKNFGLGELRLVAPRDGWPNPAAEAMAGRAGDVLEAAQVFDCVEDAVADCQVVLATTGRPRGMVKRVLLPEQGIAESQGARGAILFGAEREGLQNDEVALAHAIIEIPTAPDYASLNLAQAVNVMGYEWQRQEGAMAQPPQAVNEQAPHGEVERFLKRLEAALDEADHWKVPEKKPRMWANLRDMFMRLKPTPPELASLHGVVESLSRKENVIVTKP